MFPRCERCGEQTSTGDKLCKFCRKDYPVEYRPYDTYSNDYDEYLDRSRDYYDKNPLYRDPHQGKLVADYKELVAELQDKIQMLERAVETVTADAAMQRMRDRDSLRRMLVDLLDEYDMRDTIFGEKFFEVVFNNTI